MFSDREHVWWIVPAGQRIRHAINERPGARPAGHAVRALCSDNVKLPSHTWPASKEPASRRITDRCPECESQVAHQQQHNGDLVVTTWDS
jgi:hypothetical protein